MPGTGLAYGISPFSTGAAGTGFGAGVACGLGFSLDAGFSELEDSSGFGFVAISVPLDGVGRLLDFGCGFVSGSWHALKRAMVSARAAGTIIRFIRSSGY